MENTGNGPEAFHLVLNSNVAGDNFDPVAASPSIYFDNGDGVFGAGDTPYVAGSNDPQLNPDSLRDRVRGATTFPLPSPTARPASRADRRVRAPAPVRLARCSPARVHRGTDAVVGTSGASATTQAHYLVAGVTSLPTRRRRCSTSSAAIARFRARGSRTA